MPKKNNRKPPHLNKPTPRSSFQQPSSTLDLLPNSAYFDFGFSHQLLKIARKIAGSNSIPIHLRTQVTLTNIQTTFKQLSLNEIEACLFSIYLESFAWQDSEFSPDQILLFTGLLCKSRLNPSIEKYLSQLSTKNPAQLKSFLKYKKKYNSQATVDGLLINQRFIELASIQLVDSFPMEIEYNNLVDEILKTSVAYNTEKNSSEDKKLKKREKKHVKVSQKSKKLKKNTLVNPSPIHMLPSDSIFFPSMAIERAESYCSDFLALSKGTSISEGFRMPGIDFITGQDCFQTNFKTSRASDPVRPVERIGMRRMSDPIRPVFRCPEMGQSPNMASNQSKNFFYRKI